jgi:uncharacterized SAM-dependent methyltransferase
VFVTRVKGTILRKKNEEVAVRCKRVCSVELGNL